MHSPADAGVHTIKLYKRKTQIMKTQKTFQSIVGFVFLTFSFIGCVGCISDASNENVSTPASTKIESVEQSNEDFLKEVKADVKAYSKEWKAIQSRLKVSGDIQQSCVEIKELNLTNHVGYLNIKLNIEQDKNLKEVYENLKQNCSQFGVNLGYE